MAPFFSYEVLTAFFLEAGFIGIMLFGMDRFPARLHMLSCMVVAFGAVASAFWILAANSWMQTPAGFRMEGDKFRIVSWWAAIFTPSFPYRFFHMVVAAYLTGTFVVIGVMGWYLWRREHLAFARAGFSVAMGIAAVLAPLQLAIGDAHGLNSLRYQPIKVAAMEGDWETGPHQPLTLFAWPDMARERNDFAIAIPELGSLILTHRIDGVVQGLKSVAPENRPNVPIVFFAFRIMVAIGLALIAIAWTGLWLRWRGRPLRYAMVQLGLRILQPARLHRDFERLDGDRSGPPALAGLWPIAHGRCGCARRSRRGGGVLRAFHRRLSRAARRVLLLRRPNRVRRTAQARPRTARLAPRTRCGACAHPCGVMRRCSIFRSSSR